MESITSVSPQRPESPYSTIQFLDLPDDVLFLIFSYLPLRTVLLVEQLCQRFKQVVSSYLTTLKDINLYSRNLLDDVFRFWNMNVAVSGNIISKVLKRCTSARSITYIPPHSRSDCSDIVQSICRFGISMVQYVDSKDFFDEIRSKDLNLILKYVCLSSTRPLLVPLSHFAKVSPFNLTNVLYMEDVTVDSSLLVYCSKYSELSFVRCSFQLQSGSELSQLTLPNLCKFLYTEQLGRSASKQVGEILVRTAAGSKKLKTLCLGLSDFIPLEAAASSWKATHLEVIEIVSTGSYSASLQQLKYASIVADICKFCRLSIQIITLPSSILIKRFFIQLIAAGLHFSQLQSLAVTGLADTKMFLSPGNLVETMFYQEFLKLCPAISSLSLHSFTGSLVSLVLPFTITEVILPWDNRLNLEKQKDEILTCISAIPQLTCLSILGVEEVDSLVQQHRSIYGRCLPTIEINMASLNAFRLKNVCIRNLNLTGCAKLTNLSLHCCPTLNNLIVPVESLRKVTIYDDYAGYIDSFINSFMKARAENSYELTCHIHIQLHSVLQQEPDAKVEHTSKASHLLSVVKEACSSCSNALDYVILKDDLIHLFEHNSGEPMYPFTEFQAGDQYSSGRSEMEMRTETNRRQWVLEGIGRWRDCIVGIKVAATTSFVSQTSPEVISQSLLYCGCPFLFTTNMPCLLTLNTLPYFCQPSGGSQEDSKDVMFNVPRIAPNCQVPDLHVRKLAPFIIISIVEYAHNIYTLFYYD